MNRAIPEEKRQKNTLKLLAGVLRRDTFPPCASVSGVESKDNDV